MTTNYTLADCVFTGIICAVLGASIWGGVSAVRERGHMRPRTAYVRELNDDGNPDLIVETNSERYYTLLAQEDGTYRSLDHISQEQEKSLHEVIEEHKKEIEQQRRSIE